MPDSFMFLKFGVQIAGLTVRNKRMIHKKVVIHIKKTKTKKFTLLRSIVTGLFHISTV